MKRRSALVVDDSPVDRLILDNLLNQLGWSVFHAVNGEDAVRIMCRQDPDIILMDIVMPGMGGIETIKKMRRMLKGRWVPIVLVSGLSKDFDLLAGLSAGADDFLQKPVRPSFLRAKLRQIDSRLINVGGDNDDTAQPTTGPTDIDFLIRSLVDESFFDQLEVVYQPVFEIQGGRIVMLEALSRWHHSALGTVSPSFFVPVIEQLGKSMQMTLRVVGSAAALQRRLADLSITPTMCINVSPTLVMKGNLDVLALKSHIEQQGLSADGIAFEISGTAIVRPDAQFDNNLALLRQQGFGVGLDDISIEHLTTIDLHKVDYLKIDIDTLRPDRSDLQERLDKYQSLSQACAAADVLLCAERVEGPKDLQTALQLGCSAAQGNVLQVPLSERDLIACLHSYAAASR